MGSNGGEAQTMARDLTTEYRHIPVMLDACRKALELSPGDVYLDCTLGGAGHALVLAGDISPDGTLIGVDQDRMALNTASKRITDAYPVLNFIPCEGNFRELDRLMVDAEVPGADGILFDLGVSSPQLDFPERGFSYREDAPLDMRMDPGNNTLTAAEVIATYDEPDLARILSRYGEERWASRIAQFIVQRRDRQPIETTFQLVDVVKAAIPAGARRSGGHPAKRTFQALRIEVNDEMGVLEKGLEAAIRWLNPSGRIAVLSYHSLEDRIVKEMFAHEAKDCICPPEVPVCTCGHTSVLKVITRKPLIPTKEEIAANPRAKSAKLRVAERKAREGA